MCLAALCVITYDCHFYTGVLGQMTQLSRRTLPVIPYLNQPSWHEQLTALCGNIYTGSSGQSLLLLKPLHLVLFCKLLISHLQDFDMNVMMGTSCLFVYMHMWGGFPSRVSQQHWSHVPMHPSPSAAQKPDPPTAWYLQPHAQEKGSLALSACVVCLTSFSVCVWENVCSLEQVERRTGTHGLGLWTVVFSLPFLQIRSRWVHYCHLSWKRANGKRKSYIELGKL